MEKLYEPYEVVISEENKLIVLLEPAEEIEGIFEEETQPELMIDIDYDEEEEELYALISVLFDDLEIFFPLPYGEGWESLTEKGSFVIAMLSKDEFESGKFDEIPIIEIELDDLSLGFMEGAQRTAEILFGQAEEE